MHAKFHCCGTTPRSAYELFSPPSWVLCTLNDKYLIYGTQEQVLRCRNHKMSRAPPCYHKNICSHRARSYMFSVHNPGKMFSEHVLGTRAFILRALWNVIGTHSFKVENGTHLGLCSMTYCVYTAQRVRSFWCALSVLIAVCVLSPAHLEHCSRYTSVHTCFGCVLRP